MKGAGCRDMLGRAPIPSLSEALATLDRNLANCLTTEPEEVTADQGLRRVVATEIKSPEDLPAHSRSTMDGYAVAASYTYGASQSLPAYIKVSGEVKMGQGPAAAPGPEACFKIATGGLLPAGTDAVIMLEYTSLAGDDLIEVLKPVAPGDNVIARGDDVRKDDVILREGQRLRPQDIALLAALGLTRLLVRQRVKVGIFSSGDEIIPYEHHPGPGKIRDCNGALLTALVKQSGAAAKFYGIVPDQEKSFAKTLN